MCVVGGVGVPCGMALGWKATVGPLAWLAGGCTDTALDGNSASIRIPSQVFTYGMMYSQPVYTGATGWSGVGVAPTYGLNSGGWMGIFPLGVRVRAVQLAKTAPAELLRLPWRRRHILGAAAPPAPS